MSFGKSWSYSQVEKFGDFSPYINQDLKRICRAENYQNKLRRQQHSFFEEPLTGLLFPLFKRKSPQKSDLD